VWGFDRLGIERFTPEADVLEDVQKRRPHKIAKNYPHPVRTDSTLLVRHTMNFQKSEIFCAKKRGRRI